MQQCVRLIGRSDWKDMEHGRHAVVTITTTTGQTWRKEVWHEPMTRQELEEKFHGLVTPRLGHDRTARVKLELEQIEQAPSIRPLMEQLAGA